MRKIDLLLRQIILGKKIEIRYTDNLDIILIKLRYGANPIGRGRLVSGIFSNEKYIVKLLLDAGADPNARDSRDYTLLMHASKYGNKDIVNLLREYGAREEL